MGCWQDGKKEPVTTQEIKSSASQEKIPHERCWPRTDRSRTESTLGEAQGRQAMNTSERWRTFGSWLIDGMKATSTRPKIRGNRFPFFLAGVFMILLALFWAVSWIPLGGLHPVIGQCVCALVGAFAVLFSLTGRKSRN
jgi:hypothetical protein